MPVLLAASALQVIGQNIFFSIGDLLFLKVWFLYKRGNY